MALIGTAFHDFTAYFHGNRIQASLLWIDEFFETQGIFQQEVSLRPKHAPYNNKVHSRPPLLRTRKNARVSRSMTLFHVHRPQSSFRHNRCPSIDIRILFCSPLGSYTACWFCVRRVYSKISFGRFFSSHLFLSLVWWSMSYCLLRIRSFYSASLSQNRTVGWINPRHIFWSYFCYLENKSYWGSAAIHSESLVGSIIILILFFTLVSDILNAPPVNYIWICWFCGLPETFCEATNLAGFEHKKIEILSNLQIECQRF